MYLLGYMYHFPRIPNASKTTNKYCDCEKGTYIGTSYLVRRRDLPPRPAFYFCQVLLGCDESIDWYTHHKNNNNISVGNFKHRKGINIVARMILFFGFPSPNCTILYRYTEYSIVGRRYIQKNLHRKTWRLKPRGEILYFLRRG